MIQHMAWVHIRGLPFKYRSDMSSLNKSGMVCKLLLTRCNSRSFDRFLKSSGDRFVRLFCDKRAPFIVGIYVLNSGNRSIEYVSNPMAFVNVGNRSMISIPICLKLFFRNPIQYILCNDLRSKFVMFSVKLPDRPKVLKLASSGPQEIGKCVIWLKLNFRFLRRELFWKHPFSKYSIKLE